MSVKTPFEKTVGHIRHIDCKDGVLKSCIGALQVLSFCSERQLQQLLNYEKVAADSLSVATVIAAVASAPAELPALTGALLNLSAAAASEAMTNEGRVAQLQQRVRVCEALSRSLYSARMLLRIGEFLPDIKKIISLWDLFRAQGLYITERKKYVEFLRAVLHCLFILSDNLLFLIQNKIVRLWTQAQKEAVLYYRLRFFTAYTAVSVLFQLFELRDGMRRLIYDPPAAHRAITESSLALLRDSADYAASLQPSLYPRGMAGLLWVFSGVTSNVLLWRRSR